MSFVTHAQNKDASAFKTLVEESLAEKVVEVLDALKVEVASSFFNSVAEEGGVSGGVATVTKKPGTPKPVKDLVHTGRGGGSSVVHAGRSNASDKEKTGGALADRTNESFHNEFVALAQKLDEAHIKPGSHEHMAHHVHAAHTGDLPGMGGHVETQHYHIHHAGVEMGTDSSGNPSDKHVYHVHHKGGAMHKFHVQASSKAPGTHHVTHMGSM